MTTPNVQPADRTDAPSGIAALIAPADGIHVGVTVRVSHRNAAGLRSPRTGELGVVAAVAFNGEPTVQLDNGDIFVASRDVYSVVPVQGIEQPDARLSGRWRVSCRRIWSGHEVVAFYWVAEPLEAAGAELLTELEKHEFGARVFGIRQYGRAVAYATRKARENLR
ncbi:hypothetical protein [Microbacterium halophytorum]|uniref:hypothetical protein n=1 Tax=Microbacterium halophytorum TaxID=2067568 RepID=UPI000CFCF896|nr:hypothetical protein [Microbacterium halophytorum]